MNEEENKIEETTQEEQKQLPDNLFRLDEMTGEMEKSVANIDEVVNNQNELIDFISTSDKESFKKLVEELKMSNANLTEQRKVLAERTELLKKVFEAATSNEEIKDVVNTLLSALGVFRD